MKPTESFRLRFVTLRLLPRISPLYAGLLAGITLIGGVAPVLFSFVTSRLVGTVPFAIELGLDSVPGRRLIFLLVAAALMFVAMQAIGPFVEGIGETLGRRVDGYFRRMVMEATTEPAGVAHLEDAEILDQVSLARGVGPGRFTPGRGVIGMAQVVGQYLQAILFISTLLAFKWWLAVLMLVVRVALRAKSRRNYIKMVNVFQGQAEALRQSDYYRDLALRPDAAKETRIFQMSEWILGRFTHHWATVMQEAWDKRRRGSRGMAPVLLANWSLLLLSYGLLATEALQGKVSVENVALFAMAIFNSRAMSWITDADLQTEYGMIAVPAALRLKDVTTAARLQGRGSDPKNLPQQGVKFENVSFMYPGSTRKIFDGLNLEIPAGRSLAIVGFNGAGKTTLVKLLCRFYDVDEGKISVDGVELSEFDPELWQRRVAAIFQDFVRYHLPAQDNVGFGAVEQIDDTDELNAAAKLAGAEGIIASLPKGWDTILSRQYTDGADLSGGQWQKIALARAIVAARSDPGILVLDEPTANLDVRAEAEIYDKFFELTKGLTTVVISHRFSTVRRADEIVVLDSGKVIERGSHDDLVALKGRYSEMFTLQASRYVGEGKPIEEMEEIPAEELDEEESFAT